jgi:hypothetical protein
VILFLAANPTGTDRLALDREARSIRAELKRSGYRDRFALGLRLLTTELSSLSAPAQQNAALQGHRSRGQRRQLERIREGRRRD